MSFTVMDPDPIKRVEYAIEDIRSGRMVILIDDEDRENEGDLTMAADAISPEAINFMATHGRGLICVTLTEQRVAQLGLSMMSPTNQSPFHTAFTVSIEAREGVSTGISAHDRAQTVRVAADPSKNAQHIVTPGHIFPLKARQGGVLVRTGQTEGSVDLARMAGLTPSGVICEIMNEDGTMARLPDLERFGAEHKLRIVTVADLIRWRMRTETLVQCVLETTLPVPGADGLNARVYQSMTDQSLHLAVWKGELDEDTPVLTRVQTHCPTGDAFGTLTCDCSAQLMGALGRIESEGQGVLLYMHLWGSSPDDVLSRLKGHLANAQAEEGAEKAAAGDLRNLGTGAQILVDLGVKRLRLMTNNPRKIVGLEGFGLEVNERLPLLVEPNAANASFLQARRALLGHLLPDAPAS